MQAFYIGARRRRRVLVAGFLAAGFAAAATGCGSVAQEVDALAEPLWSVAGKVSL